MFAKVLVANRGEIAVRVIRALREMGIASVGVWSDADRGALHTRLADEAVRIGPEEPAKSYLDVDAIVDACRRTGADAVHPGYGFLAENAAFARRLAKEGIAFIGPTPQAMEGLGDKVRGRLAAAGAGVPVPPGTGVLGSPSEAMEAADSIGYPVLLKASAGGGGIGMQIVRAGDEMVPAFERARATATAAFGVPDVFLEKYLERPRHIEIQVLADHDGNAVHLGERECSIQRRHQKLLEEAPSPAVTPELRAAMGDAALRLVRAVRYENAGTMEFLVKDGSFWFNEVNARLQVEHPVTELVTGIDLVKAQVRIAAGEPLGFRQVDVTMRGHALECRVNAEDPAANFAPFPGRVTEYRMPAGPGIRVDDWPEAGTVVPQAYDSLLGKVLAWGRDRAECIHRMSRALREAHVAGVRTNIAFHRLVLANARFIAGDLSTWFIEDEGLVDAIRASEQERQQAARERAAAAALAVAAEPGGLLRFHEPLLHASPPSPASPASRWAEEGRRRALRGAGP